MRSALKKTGLLAAVLLAASFVFNPNDGGVVGHLIAADASEGQKGKGGGDSVRSCQLSSPEDPQLNSHQLRNARTILRVAGELDVPEKGGVVALATAMQESTLQNLDYGDRDSVGLFQQRGTWGSFSDRTNPEKSTRMFFQGGQQGQDGLLDIDGWEGMSVAEAAQDVQESAFPGAYAKWEPMARDLVDQCN